MNSPGLSVITLALAAQGAFAQQPETSVATATVAMTLPTDDVGITGTVCRKVKAIAASHHLWGLTVIALATPKNREQGIADMPIEGIRRITFPCRPAQNFPLLQQTP